MYNVKMSDTQWHIGYTRKKEDDPVRHKARCIYYQKPDGICQMRENVCCGRKCPGSSHCKFYSEVQPKEEDINGSRAADSNDMSVHSKTVSRANKTIVKNQDAVLFEGIKELNVNEIRASEEYRQWKPVQAEIKACISHYKQKKAFKEIVEVFVKNNRYYVCGGFVTLYVATRQLKVNRVKCKCVNKDNGCAF